MSEEVFSTQGMRSQRDEKNVLFWRVPNEPSPKSRIRPSNILENQVSTSTHTASPRDGDIAKTYINYEESENDDTNLKSNRLWNYLFANINAATDELYYLCGEENDRARCLEGIELFEQCKKDFEKLIERMDEQERFEKNQLGGVCWEVRKNLLKRSISPGAAPLNSMIIEDLHSTANNSYESVSSSPCNVQHGKEKEKEASSTKLSILRAAAAPFVPILNPAVSDGADSMQNKFDAPSVTDTASVTVPLPPTPEPPVGIPDNCRIELGSKKEDIEKFKSITEISSTGFTSSYLQERGHVTPPPATTTATRTSHAENKDSVETSRSSMVDSSKKSLDSQSKRKGLVTTSTSLATSSTNSIKITEKPLGEKVPLQSAGVLDSKERGKCKVSGTAIKMKLVNTRNTIPKSKGILASTEKPVSPPAQAVIVSDRDIIVESEEESASDHIAATVDDDEEEVWAVAEAWVQAEVHAEEQAWKEMEKTISKWNDKDSISMRLSDDASDHHAYTPLEIEASLPKKMASDESNGVSLFIEDGVPPVFTQLLSPHISSSPFSPKIRNSISHGKMIHSKLSSPERLKKLSPEEELNKINNRLSIAEVNRDRNVAGIKQKAMLVSCRVRALEDRESQRVALAEVTYAEKLKEAEIRHSQYIKAIRGKAGNENTKVSEVLFMNSLLEQDLKEQIEQRLQEAEQRIEAGRLRRQEILSTISSSQRKRQLKKAQQMSEMRLSLEQKKAERWAKLQHSMEAVRQRREARLLEMKRRREAEEKSSSSDAVDSNILPMSAHSQTDHTLISSSTKDLSARGGSDDVAKFVGEGEGSYISKKSKKSAKKKDEVHACVNEDELLNSIISETLKLPESNAFNISHSFAMHQELVNPNVEQLRELILGNNYGEKHVTSELYALSDSGTDASLIHLCPREVTASFLKLASSIMTKKEEGTRASSQTLVENIDLHDEVLVAPQIDLLNPESSLNKKRANKKKKKIHNGTVSSTSLSEEVSLIGLMSHELSSVFHIFDFSAMNFVSSNTNSVSEFVDGEGLNLCHAVLDKHSGCMRNKKSIVDFFSPFPAAKHVTGVTSNDSSKKIILSQEICYALFWCSKEEKNWTKFASSGVLVSLIDFAYFLLTAFENWMEMTVNQLRQNQMTNKKKKKESSSLSGAEDATPVKRTKPSSSGSTKSRKKSDNPLNVSSATTPSGGSSFKEGNIWNQQDDRGDVILAWRDEFKLLCVVLSTIHNLCKHIEYSNNIISQTKATTPYIWCHRVDILWLHYITKSGFINGLSKVINRAQVVASSCEYDDNLQELLKCMSSVTSGYIATVRNHGNNIQKNQINITYSLSDLNASDNEANRECFEIDLSTNITPKHWMQDISNLIRGSELCSNIVCLLGSLVLKGGVKRYSSGVDNAVMHVKVIATVLHILCALNSIAKFDLRSLQSIPQDLQILFSHISERLLNSISPKNESMKSSSFISSAKNFSKYSVSTNSKIKSSSQTGLRESLQSSSSLMAGNSDVTSSEAYKENINSVVLEQLLIHISYMCLGCPQNQNNIATGQPPTLLVQMCNLPIRYVTDEKLKLQLLPTLICSCFQNKGNKEILNNELSKSYILTILQKACSDLKIMGEDFSDPTLCKAEVQAVDPQFIQQLSIRFPVELWEEAQAFFR